ncbi:hypothetical protein PoB_006094500 [Plakobranchus ocellatus]|uniref:Uncharacterized protein n=1 Tax=Plakobranchus ocellatus TaxID=259542 RepID=A0AAV4CRA2_9GAST|nr:hypothetical protein PoB_006094500 [Plakobranchus ocellatus]
MPKLRTTCKARQRVPVAESERGNRSTDISGDLILDSVPKIIQPQPSGGADGPAKFIPPRCKLCTGCCCHQRHAKLGAPFSADAAADPRHHSEPGSRGKVAFAFSPTVKPRKRGFCVLANSKAEERWLLRSRLQKRRGNVAFAFSPTVKPRKGGFCVLVYRKGEETWLLRSPLQKRRRNVALALVQQTKRKGDPNETVQLNLTEGITNRLHFLIDSPIVSIIMEQMHSTAVGIYRSVNV